MGIDRSRNRLAATAILALLPLSACAIGPDFAPVESPDAPKVFNRHGVSASSRALNDDRWWAIFKDPTLNELAIRLIDENLDIQTAETRLAQSRAQAGITAAELFPQVNGNASYTRQKQSENGVVSLFQQGQGQSPGTQANGLGGRQGAFQNSSIVKPFGLWQNGFDASWELDFWGRVARNVEAANATADASEDARRLMQVSMISELVRNYLTLRGTQAMIAITRRNLETAQQSAGITSERFKGGIGNELDFQNAQAQVETTRAQLGPLQQQEGEAINQISFLIGEFPGTLGRTLSHSRGVRIPASPLAIGVPSDLIRQRPDVQQAEAQLHSAVAEIGSAEAEFFPRVTLSGAASLQSLKVEDLYSLKSGTYSYGPAITLPIFQGGRLQRNVELRTAQEQEAGIAYRKAVLQAFHDVDNAFIAIQAERSRLASLSRAVDRNRAALNLANKRYSDGVATFLDVLTAQTNLLATEQQLAGSRVNVATNIVRLYKALGGGWQIPRSEHSSFRLRPVKELNIPAILEQEVDKRDAKAIRDKGGVTY